MIVSSGMVAGQSVSDQVSSSIWVIWVANCSMVAARSGPALNVNGIRTGETPDTAGRRKS